MGRFLQNGHECHFRTELRAKRATEDIHGWRRCGGELQVKRALHSPMRVNSGQFLLRVSLYYVCFDGDLLFNGMTMGDENAVKKVLREIEPLKIHECMEYRDE